MIILSKAIEKSHEGSIRLTCDKEDDIYLCYNIISLNDIITMLTSRNVVHESNTGKTEKSKRQVKALELFNQTLEEDENKACYGNKEVEYAVSLKSVQTLLITDTLFRAPDPKLRNQYRNLRNSVIANGGEVLEFSSKHNSGAQLDQYTGIAAILRFPIYDTDIFSNETEKNTKTITNVDTVSTLPIARYEYDEFDEFDELDDVYK
eukprot:gene18216-23882_t